MLTWKNGLNGHHVPFLVLAKIPKTLVQGQEKQSALMELMAVKPALICLEILVFKRWRQSTVQKKSIIAPSIMNIFLGHHGVNVQNAENNPKGTLNENAQEIVLMANMVAVNVH